MSIDLLPALAAPPGAAFRKNIIRRPKPPDAFKAWLLESCTEYAGTWEMPVLPPCFIVPDDHLDLVRFSDAGKPQERESERFVHCYQDDAKFEITWNNPRSAIKRLLRYAGAIGPDYSVYREMPLVMQAWQVYRSRAVSYWWQSNGITVIPNVRWGDSRTFAFCFDGLPTQSVLAVGTIGGAKQRMDKAVFAAGFIEMIERLNPTDVVVYGPDIPEMISPLWSTLTNIHQFQSHTSQYFEERGH